MIFFASKSGCIVKVLPGSVHQGSANADEIRLFAPFAQNVQVTVAFRLADGSALPPAVMQSCGAVEGYADGETGAAVCGWTYTVPRAVSEKYGTVSVQFCFYTGESGVAAASGEATFPVSRGVPETLPGVPDADVYEQILENFALLAGEVANGYYAARALYAWNSTYVYDANEIAYYPDVGTYGAFVKSVVPDNTGNAPYIDGAINSDYWTETVSFDELHALEISAAASATSAEQNACAALSAQTSALAAQEAAEKAENNAKTSETVAAGSAGAAAESASVAGVHASEASASAANAREYMERAKQYAQKEYAVYDSFGDLPVPGDSAFIYLVPTEGAPLSDRYSEYLWITETQSYEFIGNINDIDLSDYAQTGGTYPNMTVGNAANAGNAIHATNADTATNAETAENAASAQTAAQADKMTVARAIQVNLSSSSAARFDGTEDAAPGVTGVLPVENGGTGESSLVNVAVGSATNAECDGDGNNIADTYAKCSGSYPDLNVGYAFASSSAETAASATKAEQDASGNSIAETYVKKSAFSVQGKNYKDLLQSGVSGDLDIYTFGKTGMAVITIKISPAIDPYTSKQIVSFSSLPQSLRSVTGNFMNVATYRTNDAWMQQAMLRITKDGIYIDAQSHATEENEFIRGFCVYPLAKEVE